MVRKGKYDVEKELKNWLKGAERVVVAGIGNPIRMDDFVGVKIVRDLRGKVNSDRVMLIEAETVPENYMQEIIDFKPTHVLLIDAGVIGLKAGESRLVNPTELTDLSAYSTHVLPLRVFLEYVTSLTEAKIELLLFQPKDAEFGEGLTPEVQTSAQVILSVLSKILSL